MVHVSFSVWGVVFLCFGVVCMFSFVAPDFGCTKGVTFAKFEFDLGCIKGVTIVKNCMPRLMHKGRHAREV